MLQSLNISRLMVLKWITAIVPATAIYMAETIRHSWIEPLLPAYLAGNIAVGIIAFGSTFIFAEIVFRIIEGTQAELLRRNAELEAVNAVATETGGLLEVDLIVQRAQSILQSFFAADDVIVTLFSADPDDGRDTVPFPPYWATETPSGGAGPAEGDSIVIPLQSHVGVVGSLSIQRASRDFDAAERRLLHLVSDTMSMAIKNALLLKQVRQAAVSEERNWLAREMHDGVAQLLASMLMQIDIVDAMVRDGQAERARHELEGLRTTAEDANAEVRAEIAGLRLLTNLDDDFLDRLQAYVDDFESQTGIVATFSVEGVRPGRLEPALGLQLVRILQEGLTNVRKHSGATKATVTLAVDAQNVSLCIEDDGRGFVAEHVSGANVRRRFGLLTMHERAESLGGQFNVQSGSESGTRLSVLIPLPQDGVTKHVSTALTDR